MVKHWKSKPAVYNALELLKQWVQEENHIKTASNGTTFTLNFLKFASSSKGNQKGKQIKQAAWLFPAPPPKETELQSQFYRTRQNSSNGIHNLLQDCSLMPKRKISELYTFYNYWASCLTIGLEFKAKPGFW